MVKARRGTAPCMKVGGGAIAPAAPRPPLVPAPLVEVESKSHTGTNVVHAMPRNWRAKS